MEGHIGATWRIRLNRSSEAAMRSYVKLLDHWFLLGRIAALRRPTWMRPIVTDRVAWSVCRSVGMSDCLSVCHSSDRALQKWPNRSTYRLGLRLRWAQGSTIRSGSRSPCEGAIWRGNWHSIVKYSDIIPSFVKKRLKRTRRRLGCGLRWAHGIVC